MSEMSSPADIGVWFPAVRTDTGTDVYTERLAEELKKRGIRAEITWLPLRAEYAPWTVTVPKPPEWANIAHVNTWLHHRFLPKGIPIVATIHHCIHDPALRPYKGWLRAAYHRWWIAPNERRVLQHADRVIAVSQFVADMARKTLCNAPMDIIYNGVDTRLFSPRKITRNSNEPFRLLYIGSWKRNKGVDLLAPIMKELGEDFELHYTGGIAAEKDKSKMPRNMHDLGRLNQKEVINAMQNADAFLFPSRSEGFGLVVAEAMACGLPVVAMRGTVFDEIVKNQVTGFLCERENIYDFVETIKNLKKNKSLYLNVSRAARTYSSTRLSKEAMIDSSIITYKKILFSKPQQNFQHRKSTNTSNQRTPKEKQ